MENARKDPVFHLSEIIYFQQIMFSGAQLADPLVNVSLATDYSGYPPMYMCASSTELLRDVSTMAANNADKSGVAFQLDIFEGSFHCMPIVAGMSGRQYRSIWDRIEYFINTHLNK